MQDTAVDADAGVDALAVGSGVEAGVGGAVGEDMHVDVGEGVDANRDFADTVRARQRVPAFVCSASESRSSSGDSP